MRPPTTTRVSRHDKETPPPPEDAFDIQKWGFYAGGICILAGLLALLLYVARRKAAAEDKAASTRPERKIQTNPLYDARIASSPEVELEKHHHVLTVPSMGSVTMAPVEFRARKDEANTIVAEIVETPVTHETSKVNDSNQVSISITEVIAIDERKDTSPTNDPITETRPAVVEPQEIAEGYIVQL